MSEPRKLNTGSASGGFDQSQYEAARRRAQEQANQNARRRIIQQPMRTQQQARQIRQQTPVQEPVQEAPKPVQQAPVQETPRELTHAQRQAMAYRAAAERKYGNTVQFPTREIQTRRPSQPAQQPAQRTIHRDGTAQQGRPRAQVQQLDVNQVQGSRPAFNYDEAAPAAGGIQMEETPRTHKAHHKDEAAPRTHRANGGGRKSPRDGDPADPKPHGKKGGKGNGGKKKKKKGDTLGIVAGIFAGIAVIALAIWGWSFMTGGSKNEVECPELVNHTCAEALELIEGTKLKIVQENGKEIQADDEGIIVTQDPKSGKKIKNNAKITVTLGDQPATMEKIPSVAGMTEADATSALKALKFDVTVERQDNSDVAAGRVISTHPAAGTSASEGSVVTIYVSNGNKSDNTENEYTIVPDLLGKTENEAKSALERADLKLGEVQQVASEKEKGTVVKQSEAEGNRVKKNKAIDIRISSGKAATSATPTPSAKPSASASPSSTPKPSSTPTSSGDDEPNEGGNNGTNED